MPGSTQPIFARVGKIGQGFANTAVTGGDLTNATLIFTADATNGSIVNEVRVKYVPGTNTAATAFRVWVNNGGANVSSPANNSLISEITIGAITATNTAATPDYVVPMPRGGLVLPPSYRLYATISTWTTGNFSVSAFGGDY